MKTRAWLVAVALACAAVVSATSRAATSYQGQVVIPSFVPYQSCDGYAFVTYSGDEMSCRPIPGGATALGANYSVAADGTIAFSGERGVPAPVTVSRPDGSFVTADPGSLDFDPTITPDGSKIAFGRYTSSDPHAGSNIYTVNPDGSDLTLVAAGSGSFLSSPAFSPDGSTIAYSCSDAGGSVRAHCGPLPDGSYGGGGLMLMGAGGGGKHEILLSGAGTYPGVGAFQSLSWSPDGQMIATGGFVNCPVCTGAAGGVNSQVFLYHTNGSDLFNSDVPGLAITHETDDWGPGFPQFTADGSNVLYLRYIDDDGLEGNYSYLVNTSGFGRHEICLTPDPGLGGTCGGIDWGVVVPPPTGGGPPPSVNAMRIKVPALHGLTLTAATKRLASANFRVGTVTRQSSSLPAGRVVKQSPLAGSPVKRTKWKGPKVNLVLSRGPRS